VKQSAEVIVSGIMSLGDTIGGVVELEELDEGQRAGS
jgi:hypothetical protein